MAKRKCPHCAEMVRREAKVCRHCGRDLPLITATDAAAAYFGAFVGLVIVIGLLFVMTGGLSGGPKYEDPPSANSDDWYGYSALSSFDFDCRFQGFPAPDSAVAALGLSCSDLRAFRVEVCSGHTWKVCDPDAD